MFLKIHKYLGKITFNKKIDSIFLHMIFKIDNHYTLYSSLSELKMLDMLGKWYFCCCCCRTPCRELWQATEV